METRSAADIWSDLNILLGLVEKGMAAEAAQAAQAAASAQAAPVVVAPVVVAPPVVEGSVTAGTLTRPTSIEEMTEIRPGVWRSNDLSGKNKAVLVFDLGAPMIPRGATLSVSADISSNVVIDNSRNIKFFLRNWLGQIGGKVLNDYICSQKSGAPEFTTEQIVGVTAKGGPWTRFYCDWPKFTDKPTTWYGEYTYPTAVGKSDGDVFFSVNGKEVFGASGWQADDANHPGTRSIVCLQLVYAPISGDAGKLPANAYIQFENVRVTVSK